MDMTTLAKSIFEFANKDKYNCLMILFDMMAGYKSKTGKLPDSTMPMFTEIETSAFHLIKMAEDNNLNMDDVLNHTADNGRTLFYQAAVFSESVAIELLKRNVVVTKVDNLFSIPSFRVS